MAAKALLQEMVSSLNQQRMNTTMYRPNAKTLVNSCQELEWFSEHQINILTKLATEADQAFSITTCLQSIQRKFRKAVRSTAFVVVLSNI